MENTPPPGPTTGTALHIGGATLHPGFLDAESQAAMVGDIARIMHLAPPFSPISGSGCLMPSKGPKVVMSRAPAPP